MRISDWSSDVCSSDLAGAALEQTRLRERREARRDTVTECLDAVDVLIMELAICIGRIARAQVDNSLGCRATRIDSRIDLCERFAAVRPRHEYHDLVVARGQAWYQIQILIFMAFAVFYSGRAAC